MKISFEVIPRTLPALAVQYQFACGLGGVIDAINVPDIQRFAIRSWQTGQQIDRSKHRFIPHFRAGDFSIKDGEIFAIIERQQLDDILLVSGDPPEGIRQVHNTSVLDLIAAVHRRFPSINIHAGFDPHRSGLQTECEYVLRKRDAGASSFFSQPFYDSRLLEIYADHLQGLDLYIGLSPIVSTASKNYWQVKNKVQFPPDFVSDYGWNIAFARQVIAIAKARGLNIYFMPIKIDLELFFAGLNLGD